MVAIRYVFPRWSFRHNFLSVASAQTSSGFLTKIESFDISCILLSGFLEFASLLRPRQRDLAERDRFRLLSNKFESGMLILFYTLAERISQPWVSGFTQQAISPIDRGSQVFKVLIREDAND